MIVFVLLVALGDADAAARLAQIRANFSVTEKRESLRALEQLAREAPSADAGGQAAAWRGALAQQAGDLGGAAIWYERAAGSSAESARRLGLRGLGDLDMVARRYASARRNFAEAANGSSGVLAEELAQKQLLARKLERRQWIEYAAWIFFAATLGYLLRRVYRAEGHGRSALLLPVEVIYVLPVYLLLLAGGAGRDPKVFRALIWGALGSLSLILVSGWAAHRAPPTRHLRIVHTLLLVAANLALFYAVVNRADIYDSLVMTAKM